MERVSTVNHDLLGPLFYRFLFKLYLTQFAYNPDETRIIFLARGGLRIRNFFQQFLEANKLKNHVPYSDFYVSRMALIKVGMISHYEVVIDDFLKEYRWNTVGETVSLFFGKEVFTVWKKKFGVPNLNISMNQDSWYWLLWGDTESADYLRGLLREQQDVYLEYLKEILGEKKNVLAIDTGWSGSILNYMQMIDEKREYTGQFFGRYNYGNGEMPWFDKVIGVEIEGHDFTPKRPVTALFLNRHLIEGLCEIRWPSVTGYQRMSNSRPGPIEGFAPEDCISSRPEEAQAYGVMQYIAEAKDGLDIKKIHESAEMASRKLCRRLMYPCNSDLRIFSVETRSADFGKNLEVPFLLAPIHKVFGWKMKLENIKNSLWPVGQITLEFPKIHRIVQFVFHRRKFLGAGLLRRLNPN